MPRYLVRVRLNKIKCLIKMKVIVVFLCLVFTFQTIQQKCFQNSFIYLFLAMCGLCCCKGFSLLRLLLLQSTRSWAPWLQYLQHVDSEDELKSYGAQGLVARQVVGSSWIRD